MQYKNSTEKDENEKKKLQQTHTHLMYNHKNKGAAVTHTMTTVSERKFYRWCICACMYAMSHTQFKNIYTVSGNLLFVTNKRNLKKKKENE